MKGKQTCIQLQCAVGRDFLEVLAKRLVQRRLQSIRVARSRASSQRRNWSAEMGLETVLTGERSLLSPRCCTGLYHVFLKDNSKNPAHAIQRAQGHSMN